MLKTHVKKIHQENGNFSCQFCNVVLKYRTSLRRHIRRRHSTEKLPVISESNKTDAAVTLDSKKGTFYLLLFKIIVFA